MWSILKSPTWFHRRLSSISGVVIDATSFRASPSPERVSRLLSTAGEFQFSASPPASLWLSLLGVLSSLAHLVPGGRLQMRSLQLCLHRSWDRLDLEAPVSVSQECLRDLQWWLHLLRLSSGVCLCQVSPDVHFWSDASDVGWGAHLDRRVASGLWDSHQTALSINARELLAVQLGLRQVQSSLQGCTVAVFCDNTTAVAYLRKEGGTRSPLLNSLAQEILRWTESLSIRLAPQFLPGSNSVLADALSRPPPAPTFRVVAKHDRLSVFKKVLAGPNRLVCHLRKSALFDLLLTIPRSDVSRHRRVSPVLGRTPSLRVPSSGHHSACSSEAPVLLGDGAHSGGSALGPASLVLALVIFTRISIGSGFMPGDSPAIYQACWILLRSSGAVFAGAPSILARCLSSAMVHLSFVVSRQWPFCFSSYLG